MMPLLLTSFHTQLRERERVCVCVCVCDVIIKRRRITRLIKMMEIDR